MGTVDTTRAELALLVLYLSKSETRDKFVRAIQYGSKFISNGEPGIASTVDKQSSLARKLFRLLKYLNEVHALVAPAPKNTPLPLVLLAKARHALVGTFLALDQIVWAGRVGIYKNKERTDLLSRISLYCWLAGNSSSVIIELAELARLGGHNKRIDRELKQVVHGGSAEEERLNQLRAANAQTANARTLNLVKCSLDLLVAAGLLQLAPRTITPRRTGACGFVTSLITLYQLLPSHVPKAKAA
eukprot:TRINITY_DN19630_c0_g1_i1.p1 TRINITY_DN19630_c0_g1~~TRINITY_DN19630_c0_g1_i1.p1  ORF type:complete len:244 (-),score=36.36 TRINITY_DN19630_c0_g1_i1:208-939(-)